MKEESFYDRNNKRLLIKKRNFIIRMITLVLAWSFLIFYFVSPFSKVSNISINGNVFLTDSQILEIAKINRKKFKIDIDNKDVKRRLNLHDCIKNANSKISLFSNKIEIEEIYPIGKNDSRTLWSDGHYSNQPLSSFYGYIPSINTTINNSFIEDFAFANSSWGELRKSKKMLSIEEKDYDLTVKKTYSLSFEEEINEKIITIVFVIDKENVTRKLNIELYQKIVEEIKSNSSLIVDDVVTVGYCEQAYSYWRL